MSGFYVAYRSNCLADKSDERGLTHFLEHLICRQLRPMMDAFNQYAVDFNAITSNDYVVFYVAGLDDYVHRFKKEFYERLVEHPALMEVDVKEERPVILQEYTNHFDVPFNAILANGLRKHYDYYGAMGLASCIENAGLEILQPLYDKRFSTPYMVINVSEKYPFDGSFIPDSDTSYRDALAFRDTGNAILETVYPNSVLMLGLKDGIPNAELPKTQLLNYLLAGDIHKPLLYRLREQRGFCYSADLSEYVVGSQHLEFFSTEVSFSNRDAVLTEFYSIMNNADSLITKEMFDKAVEHLTIKRRMQMIGRHNNITDQFYPNLMREGVLESLSHESIIEFVHLYFSDPESRFLIY